MGKRKRYLNPWGRDVTIGNTPNTEKLAESYRLGLEADHERAARLERWVSDLSRSLDLAYRTVEERDEAIEYWSKMAEGRGAAIERLTKAILKHREVRRRRKHGVRTYDADLYKEIER